MHFKSKIKSVSQEEKLEKLKEYFKNLLGVCQADITDKPITKIMNT